MAFDPWVTRENIRRFRDLLETTADLRVRRDLHRLLDEEEAKLPPLESAGAAAPVGIGRLRRRQDEDPG